MNNKNIVPIVFTFDNNFFIPAVVTFYSMIKNANENTYYDIFIMADLGSFATENKADLLEFEATFSNKCKITYIDMQHFGDGFTILDKRFNLSVYYRLFVHEYIQLDKVIFSDVDVVIQKDLFDVYSLDLGDHYLGAIKQSKVNTLSDSRYKKYINKASGIKKGNYFNAGFIVMDLKKLRAGNFTAEFIKLSKVGFNNNDQDILNLVFENKVTYVPIEYCYIPIDSYYHSIEKGKLLKIHTPSEMDDYERKPAIVHYAGTKPWNIEPEEVAGLELDKFNIWWGVFHECLDFINRKAIFGLYSKFNHNVIEFGQRYSSNSTIGKTFGRLASMIAKKIGIYPILKSGVRR
jgi:UDP-glucose:(galactosyl)LPS alpha-1,2-glucosyltransferase